jgi:hypothetical protein
MALDWNALEQIPDEDLAVLVAAAIDVVKEHSEDSAVDVEVDALPASVLRTELVQGLELDEETVDRMIDGGDASRAVGLALLREIGDQPELRAEIEQAYEDRKQMMIVEVGLIAAAALLVLVMKVKKIKVVKGEGVTVDFDPFRPEMVKGVKSLLGA